MKYKHLQCEKKMKVKARASLGVKLALWLSVETTNALKKGQVFTHPFRLLYDKKSKTSYSSVSEVSSASTISSIVSSTSATSVSIISVTSDSC